MTLAEIYAILIKKGVRCFSGDYGLEAGADAVVIKMDDSWGMFLDDRRIRTTAEETVAVSHELAHIVKDATYGIDAPVELRRLAEQKAERWQIETMLPWTVLARHLRRGLAMWEIAEAEGVTEAFVREAIAYYTERKGKTA